MVTTSKLLPKYIKFANRLQTHINDGEFPPGTMLPSQRELAQRFGTTLMTLRKALNLLEDEGLIRTEHGVGTFVLDPNVQEKDFQLFSLGKEANKSQEIRIDTEVLQAIQAAQNEAALAAFGLSSDNKVGLLERLRFLDGEPFIVQRSFLPPQFAHLVSVYEPTRPLYDFIRQETGQAVTMAKEILQPVLLTAVQATRLNKQPNTPAWLSIRLSTSQDGTPLLYDEAILKHDSFIVTMQHVGKRTQCQLQMRQSDAPTVFEYLFQ